MADSPHLISSYNQQHITTDWCSSGGHCWYTLYNVDATQLHLIVTMYV